MLRPSLIACALLASATCAARPMIIHQSQTLLPPASGGYYFFGYDLAIDGDWAIIFAATPSGSTAHPQQTHDALLYHRVNGQWTLDRTLARRVSQDVSQSAQFTSVAMSNGVAAIGSAPTQIFKLASNTWTEIAHPFNAPYGDPNYVSGKLEWDGSTLLAVRWEPCGYSAVPWGALISRLNTDGSWTPVEHLSSDDSSCNQEPIHWGISGDTVVAGTWTNDFEIVPDQLRIFRRSGTSWMPTSAIDGGDGQADVRGNEIFYTSRGPRGTLVYRNDDTQTVVDNIRTVTASYRDSGRAYSFKHSNDAFIQNSDVFRKNAAGKYEHVATLLATGPYATTGDGAISGRRVLTQGYGYSNSSSQAALIFDLPETYTPSPVIASGFENGSAGFIPQLGTWAVAPAANGNHVYRQSNVAADYRVLLGNSDWAEQSIEADIRPTAFSGADRWAGLAVRYLDAANYYYVTLRSSGVVQLKTMRNGAFTTVAQKALPIVAGRSYHVALHAEGTYIRVFIDGKVFVSTQDLQPIPHGSAALLGYRTAVDYDNVVAAQAGQRPIYDLFFANCNGSLSASEFWTTNGAGNWNCSGATGTNIVQQSSTVDIARALVGTPTDDQEVTARARLTSVGSGQDRWFGITARYVDASNYYYLTVRNSNTVSLRKLVNGAITVLGTATLTVTPNTWYDLRLDAVGNELRAFVNGVQLFQVTDSSHASGQGGLLTYKTGAEYSNYLSWQP